MVTPQQISTFERDGFIVVDDLLSADELERFGSAVDAGVAERHRGDTRHLEDKSLYEQTFLQCANLWEDNPGIGPLAFSQRIGEAAGLLLGADRLRIWHDQALYKEPGGRQTDVHQDWPLWPIGPARQITAWIPFDGSTLDCGAMGYSPGSHRLGLARFSDITRELRDEPYPYFDDPAMADLVWVEAPPGSVVFHHSLTVHQARSNTTDRPRRVYCIIYFEDGCVRSRPDRHQSLERQNIRMDEPVVGPVTPIAWPRPDADVPDPATNHGSPPRTGFRY